MSMILFIKDVSKNLYRKYQVEKIVTIYYFRKRNINKILHLYSQNIKYFNSIDKLNIHNGLKKG